MSPAKKQASKPAHENLATLDKVVELAMELKEINDRYNIVESAVSAASSSRQIYVQDEIEQLGHRGDAIREGISAFKAQTIPGALVHMAELEAALDHMDGGNEFQNKKTRATIERLASSVKSVLIAATPKWLLDALPELNEHLDRWAPYEERLEIVERLSAVTISPQESDPVTEMIAEHKARIEFANKRGLPDGEVARRSDLADEAWWALIDAEPKTINGAAELAKYVAEIEESNLCPTKREIEGPTEHGATIALRRIATFIAATRSAA